MNLYNLNKLRQLNWFLAILKMFQLSFERLLSETELKKALECEAERLVKYYKLTCTTENLPSLEGNSFDYCL